uniref:Uncharacterized protein n=1 Tax=Anguilla anguilla TaxID=7936 RepID=A0A0E9QIU9_ANGAN
MTPCELVKVNPKQNKVVTSIFPTSDCQHMQYTFLNACPHAQQPNYWCG